MEELVGKRRDELGVSPLLGLNGVGRVSGSVRVRPSLKARRRPGS
jgi:hypothetical protein